MDSSLPSTPLMRQYHSIKKKVPNTLLLFRLGDFYELFYEDALVASRELQITLTSRNKEKGEPIPMCGVPAHAADNYISKLIAKGFRVAICDQVEDPKSTKKLVRRELTRIITPGTASDASLLRANENNYLAAVVNGGRLCGLAYADISTGEFRMTEMEPEEVPAALEHLGAREVLFPSAGPLFAGGHSDSERGANYLRTELDPWVFDIDYAQRTLCDHFKLLTLDGLGAEGHHAAVRSAGAVLHYVRDTQRVALQHLDAPKFIDQNDWMALDLVTVRNLELVEPLFRGPAESTLLWVINKTKTNMGARLLRQWLVRPSVDREEIESRLDGVEELTKQTISRTEVRRELGGVLDVERLLSRITMGSATPRELLALGTSLRGLPMLRALVAQLKSGRMKDLYARLEELPEVRDRILKTLSDEPPVHVADGDVIREGVDATLDELRDLQQNGRQYIAQMEAREKQATGIGSLKIRFNNVFGFYIEISKPNLPLVPDHYERKQTLVNHERFTTPELKEHERKVLDAEERIEERERRLFDELRDGIAAEAQRIRSTAAALAELDTVGSLAVVAAESHYVRPQFNSQGSIQIAGGRHPVVERLMETSSGDRFIANDVYLNNTDNLLAMITGPNMGGKSTYLRQVALICILAQMGSFVPATSATLPIVDRIFTRIGASDNVALGRSTFMVEMTETAQILNSATPDSLILLDEVGRGTSTFDGLSIAWAVVEYVHARTRAKTLFATHYHELTELAELLTGVTNLHVAVKEAGDSILFLRKVEPGRADRSYGIEVARLAGLPHEVIERARAVLKRHEEREQSVSEELSIEPHSSPVQVSIFNPCDEGITNELHTLNLDELKPIEALSLLHEWKERVRRRKTA